MMRIIAAQARAFPTVSRRPGASADAAAAVLGDFAEDTDAVVVVMGGPPQSRSVSPARVMWYCRIVIAARTSSSPTAMAEAYPNWKRPKAMS